MTDEDRMHEEGAEFADNADHAPDMEPGDMEPEVEASLPVDEGPVLAGDARSDGPSRKRCVCCGEIIPMFALNCKHCRSWVALWEGSIAKEYFYLLAAALICLFGTLLPWKPIPEGAPAAVEAAADAEKGPVGRVPRARAPQPKMPEDEPAVQAANLVKEALKPVAESAKVQAETARNQAESVKSLVDIARPVMASSLRGIDFMSGAVIFIFSAIMALTCLYNIRSKRLVFWPVMLLLVVNLFILIDYYLKPAGVPAMVDAWTEGTNFIDKIWQTYRTQGIGIYFVTVSTLFIILQIILSVFKAAGKDKERKAISAATAGARGGRRR